DASMTHGDAFFRDNHSFNETLFDQVCNEFDHLTARQPLLTVAAELRWQHIQQSIVTTVPFRPIVCNPQFSFVSPRYFTAYAESIFPLLFFVDSRKTDVELDMTTARGFFQNSQMPDGFFCSNRTITSNITTVFSAHPIQPGKNEGVGNYVLDPTSTSFQGDGCLLYTNFVNQTVWLLYPNPGGVLLDALNQNLDYFSSPLVNSTCTQVFPYGKPGNSLY
ncbi:hypothetical protein BDQ17DRAFT_1363839, partial [Cyathus striatus]